MKAFPRNTSRAEVESGEHAEGPATGMRANEPLMRKRTRESGDRKPEYCPRHFNLATHERHDRRRKRDSIARPVINLSHQTTSMPKPKSKSAELASAVAEKIADQVKQLVIDNWTDIDRTMNADEGKEIKISFATTMTHRAAEEGNVASKDSRILTTLAMSLGKLSDKTESPFPDPQQMELGGTDQQPE